jgi:hypothetical protein
MPIILAIEPDRRQRDALAAVVRQRVGAELVLADTTERALEAIGNRVPDLVLVPALLSPQDDAALAAALRVIAAAAHVRTLMIPVLAAHSEAARPSGLLSRWRKGRSASEAPDGCDPAVFAEQIVAYLKESAAERALRADDDFDDAPRANKSQNTREFGQQDLRAGANTHVTADGQSYTPIDTDPDAQVYVKPDVAYTQPNVQAYAQPDAEAYVQPDVPVYVQPDEEAYAQPDVHAYAQPDEQLHMQVDAQNEVVGLVEGDEYDTADRDGVSAQQLKQDEDIDLSDKLSELETEESEESDWTRRGIPDTELFDGEPIGVYTMPSVADNPDLEVPVVTRSAFGKAPTIPRVVAKESPSLSEFDADAALDPEFFTESFRPVFAGKPRTEPVFEEEAAVARAFEAEPTDSAPPADDVYPAGAEPEPTDDEPWGSAFMVPRGEWLEKPEALPTPVAAAASAPIEVPAAEARHAPAPHKRDRPEWSELVASLRKDIERRRVDPPQETPTPTATAAAADTPVARRSKKSKPVQDEWGFFDPEQCGFAALLAKLDEITEEDVEVHQAK